MRQADQPSRCNANQVRLLLVVPRMLPQLLMGELFSTRTALAALPGTMGVNMLCVRPVWHCQLPKHDCAHELCTCRQQEG